MATFAITTLTPQAIQQSLQNDGLTGLGLTNLSLSPAWASAQVGAGDYSQDQMTLNIATAVQAPFLGIRRFAFEPVESTLTAGIAPADTSITIGANANAFPTPAGGAILMAISNDTGSKREIVSCTARAGNVLTVVRGMENTSAQSFSSNDRIKVFLKGFLDTGRFLDVNGAPLTGAATVLELHPNAVLRLERVASFRYGDTLRPIPWAMVVHGVEGYLTAQRINANETMNNVSGAITFHDGRGQIIDPVFVAALFEDLINANPGLLPAGAAAPQVGQGGSVAQIRSLATGVRVHFTSLHGGPFQAVVNGASMVTRDGANNPTPVPASGLVTLQANHTIAADAGDQGRLRWGFATNGLMGRTPLSRPVPAAGTLPRDFLRVAVADADWALMGNRTAGVVLGVKGSDQRIPPELLHTVRDQVTINYLPDGMDTLGAASAVLARQNQQMIIAVSPVITGQLATPAAPGANAHWPAFPAPNTNAGFAAPPALNPGVNVTAAFVNANDVVVTFTGGVAPTGATVRIFPQQFVEIAAITADEPSFLRGDGGSNIADGSGTVSVLLPNPFALAQGQPKPNPAVLTMDVVIAPRLGRRVLFGAVSVNVAAGPVALPPDPFVNPLAVLNVLDPRFQSVAPSPLFGIPAPPPNPPAPGGGLIALATRLLFDPPPRQAARLPTMARFDTIVVTGTTGPPAPQPANTLLWEAVVTGARWANESRSDQHASGNPGNPAARDIHAAGVHVTGALAYDVAVRALKLAQPLFPTPVPNGPAHPGWVVASGGNNFNVPSDTGNTGNTSIGVLLETVAIDCETPILGSLNPPPANLTLQQLANDAAAALGIGAPAITVQNEARLQREVRREFFAAKHGFRDAQWSLLRALSEARELVYVESPQFTRTARGAGADYKADLVAVLVDRLTNDKRLRVLICIPREPDFDTKFKGWWRRHFKDRTEAVSALTAVDAGRVAVFHPVGFPGRPALIRTTSVVVDDVWCCVGSTHFRRRGMTFDGSTAIASFDRQLEEGYSKKVRDYRRNLMAAKLGVTAPAAGQAATADWIRLGRPHSAFDLVSGLLAQGGLGRIQPLWPGPADNTIQATTTDIADPEGSTEDGNMVTTLAGMLNEAGD